MRWTTARPSNRCQSEAKAGPGDRAKNVDPQIVTIMRSRAIRVADIGGAFGSAILNSGSDRTISTATTVSIDLRNAGPEVLGSALLRIEDVAIGALTTRY